MSTSLPAAVHPSQQTEFIAPHGLAANDPTDPRATRPGRVAELLARLHAGALDRSLIAGADPASSAQLRARSRQLTRASTRAVIADGLQRLRESGESPQRRFSAVGQRDAIRGNAGRLDDLTDLLRGDLALAARGVAVLSELLSDGTGVAYLGPREALTERLEEARAALLD